MGYTTRIRNSRIVGSFRQLIGSNIGLIVLGFMFATLSGAFINHLVQLRSWQNQTQFEIFKLSLQEAKILQEELLSLSSKRYFYMGMVYGRLKSDMTTYKEDLSYWQEHLTPVKDIWNQRLSIFYSKLRVLFDKDIADMLMIAHDDTFKDYSYQTKFSNNKNLQNAFEDAHETLYYLLFVCEKKTSCKNWNEMTALAKKQLKTINSANSDLSNAIVKRLLDTPYGLTIETNPDKK